MFAKKVTVEGKDILKVFIHIRTNMATYIKRTKNKQIKIIKNENKDKN